MMEKEQNPLWYKQAVIYQVHVKSFYDSNGDGIGDFVGLKKKLGYLESLGVTAIWLLPFYPSPLKDDGYDIADYYQVHPNYGTLNDFRSFLREAHKRGLRVITELVINHTSDQHAWFQRARLAEKDSDWRNFYVWSDDPEKYSEARIIFQDFEASNWTWDSVAQAYYWHRFYSHQPDLNFENPLVQKEVLRALDFWFEMGVDGLRLDAIPYLFEQEGTNCENLPATHEFIRKLRKHTDEKYQNRVLIAEANQWPEDAVAYFGQGDECHMAFHFPVMPRLFMAIHMEDRFPIIDILEQTPLLPANCQWVMFLRNHDELTLEMVSDEERDYMYQIYAKDPKARINLGIRRRLSPLLDSDRRKIELMNILLFSLPGTPVLYYGDEIGMGDNYYLGDRDGVRTPMQWSPDRNAGFSTANSQQLYLPVVIDPSYHYEVVNVENRERHASSLLWWIRRTLQVRKKHLAFGMGSLEFILSDNSKILAFTRTYLDEIILIIVNLSHFSQATTLDLTSYLGYTPIELFHRQPFPCIKEANYAVTIGGHGYYWLELQNNESFTFSNSHDLLPKLNLEKKWENIFSDPYKRKLEKEILPLFFKKARWFERKLATIQSIKILSSVRLGDTKLCFVEIIYLELEERDFYLLPVAFAVEEEKKQLLIHVPQHLIATVLVDDQEGYLYDGLYSPIFRQALIELILKRKKIKFGTDELVALAGENLKIDALDFDSHLPSIVVKGEQTHSSILFAQHFFFKLYRKLEAGIHTEIEVQKFITEIAKFPYVPKFEGRIEWVRSNKESSSIGILESVVANEGTLWNFTLNALTAYYENLLTFNQADLEYCSTSFKEIIGGQFQEIALLLGQRTAEMHAALASQTDYVDFRPESFTLLYQRSLYQTMRNNTRHTLQLLERNLSKFSADDQIIAKQVLAEEANILNFYQKIFQTKFSGRKIRIHGDYHLGQVLYTGKDFYIIDFEGEPQQPLSQRRFKRSPLMDVASMLRSFHYAVYKNLFSNPSLSADMISLLEPGAIQWYEYISKLFLDTYYKTLAAVSPALISAEKKENELLLQVFLLNKAIHELGYELQTRPDWLSIACKGILYHLKKKSAEF